MYIPRFPFINLFALATLLFGVASSQAQSPPANDDFANRQVLPSEANLSVQGTTVGATQEAFEQVNGAGLPAGESINETKTVWYQWTPPVSGTVHANITDSQGAETYLLVFQGDSVPMLSELVGQGYLPADGTPYPLVSFKVIGGQVYTLSLGNTDYPQFFSLLLNLTPDVPSVAITAPEPVAIRSTGQKGEFLFTLSAPADAPLTLHYKVAGNAVAGVDYKRLRGTVTVPAGASTAQVNVRPLPKGSDEGGEPTKVKLTLESGQDYTAGSPATATVKIREHPSDRSAGPLVTRR